ncbi:class I SAM-dependent methyltransferase [Candidatus Microgenomates bacterium]|nr:MAG: class I SAM-dependent methyltransferase [Candidatus Microgenomates bacterium]
MKEVEFLKLLACPRCKKKLRVPRTSAYCSVCKKRFYKIKGVWHLLGLTDRPTKESQKIYDLLFQTEFVGPDKYSYQILAALTRGNKAIDIAAGAGLIEKYDKNCISLDFSLNALKQAQKNGAKFLILADAHHLPFVDSAFDVAISAGNLEHFSSPLQALREMARVSKTQCMIIHKYPPIPFAQQLFPLVSKLFSITHQPIEKPFAKQEMHDLMQKARLQIIFEGTWRLPFNYGRPISWLPQIPQFPSAWFVITSKI